MDVRMLTVGQIAENCFLFRQDGSDRALIVDPGDEAERILGAVDELGVNDRGDPAHPHPLRPHRRGGAGREGDRRAGLVPGDRDAGPRRHQLLRALAGVRALRELRRRPHRERRREARARGPRDRRDLHPRPQPRPRHLLGPGRGGDLLRRRPLPGLGRPHRPARRRLGRRCSSRSARWSTPIRPRPPSIPGTWASRRSAPSARPTPSWPSSLAIAATPGVRSRADGEQVQGTPRGTFDVLPEQQPVRERIAGGRPPEASRRPATGRSTRRSSRTPTCSRAASASPPTSSRRRCSPSRTRADAALTLRPEATASICRAYLEHGMHKLAQPVKLWMDGPLLPPRAPAGGSLPPVHARSDAEAIGSDSPLVDAEMILLASDILIELGVEGVRLRLGSLGSPAARAAYLDELRDYLRSHEGRALRRRAQPDRRQPAARLRRRPRGHPGGDGGRSDDARPARPGGRRALRATSVRSLDRNGVAYELDPTLVRGLDYYTRTVFEFDCESLGAQSGIGGGGRYDGLIEQLGGPADAGLRLGARSRADRARSGGGAARGPDQPRQGVFVVAGDDGRDAALALVTELRRAGIPADLDLAGRGDEGTDEAGRPRRRALRAASSPRRPRRPLRDMDSGEERQVDPATLVETLSSP